MRSAGDGRGRALQVPDRRRQGVLTPGGADGACAREEHGAGHQHQGGPLVHAGSVADASRAGSGTSGGGSEDLVAQLIGDFAQADLAPPAAVDARLVAVHDPIVAVARRAQAVDAHAALAVDRAAATGR